MSDMASTTTPWRGFASDNYAGVHPAVFDAMARVNTGHQVAYGEDDETGRLAKLIMAEFGPRAEVFPVFNGTGANVVALTSAMPRWGAIIATDTAHIHTDEGGAPERVSGLKLFTVPPVGGKLTPEGLRAQAFGRGDEHRPQPMAVSITQSTELGTVYTPDEVADLVEVAHSLDLIVHMDGARLFNAAASLGVPFRAFTSDVGVDLVSLGATKNGAMAAEAIVVVNPDAADGLIYLRKLSMQLSSKMRFVSAQLAALLTDGLGIEIAHHSNTMAALLRTKLDAARSSGAITGLDFSHPTQANAVFALLDPEKADRIREHVRFYDWNRATGEVRWMCSWDTTEDDIDAFVETITTVLAS
jgi:threonine aldolase